MSARVLVVIAGIAALTSCAASVQPARPQGAPAPQRVERSDSGLSPVVETCIDGQGEITDVHIVSSSNVAEIDEAALKVARASRYTPGTDERGRRMDRSCVKFRVKFVLKDGEPVPAGN